MKTKQLISLLLALVMVLSLAACSGGNNTSASTGEGGNTSESAGTGENAAANEGSELPTFHVAIMRWNEGWGTAFTETAFLKQASEEAGVNIIWDPYYAADWSEQKSLILAGGTLPDAFFGSAALTDADVSKNKMSFVELTQLIADNMPNLSKILAEDETMKGLCTDTNGEIYSLPKKLPLRPISANQLFINTDFLAAVNMEMPDTYEDLANFLIACGTQDPDGNGEADTWGETQGPASLSDDLNNLLLPFGVQCSRVGNYMSLDENGEPVFIPTTEKFKEAVKWARYIYENGGLDPERFTQDNSLANSKVQAEGGSKVGAVWQWSADAETGANAPQFKVCQAVKGPDGVRYVESDPTYLNYGRNELLITKSCSDPAALLRWADLFYTDLASLQNYYGSIDDGKIAANDDGTYEVLIPEDGTSLDVSSWTYSFRDHGPKYMSTEFESKIILPQDQGDGAKLAANEIDIPNVHETFPVVQYTDEQLTTLTRLTTDIYNYLESTYAAWVVNGGIDEGWDAYIEQLNAMGLEEVVQIQKDAYAFYKGE